MQNGKSRPLSELNAPADDEAGYWQYEPFFHKVDTCYQWRVRPSSMGLCAPEEDFGVMMAYTREITRMRAWEQTVQAERAAEERERKSAGAGTSGLKYGRRR